MQRHRIFIAINPPIGVKKELLGYRDKWPDLPAKWVAEDNPHITLNFLGYVSDEDIVNIIKAAENASSKHPPFYLKLNKICYGPDKKIPPRMLWARGKRSEDLDALKDDLNKELNVFEGRGFVPHITLARIKTWAWQRMEPEERPKITEDIDLSFKVDSIDVMESVLKKGGAEYTILQSFNLKAF